MENLSALVPYLAAVVAMTFGQLLTLFGPGLLLVGLLSQELRGFLGDMRATTRVGTAARCRRADWAGADL